MLSWYLIERACFSLISAVGDLVASWHWDLPGAPSTLR
jgi:hypothetical protein